MSTLLHADITDAILKCFFTVGNELGHGFLESVNQNAMFLELTDRGLKVRADVSIPVAYRGRIVGNFRADLVVEGVVLVDVKAAKAIDASAIAQTLNYLRATGIEVGLLLSFGPRLEFRRLAFDNTRKTPSPSPGDPPDRFGSSA